VELAQSNYVFTRWTQLAFPFEHEEIVTFRLKVKPGGDNHFHFFGGKAHGRGSGIPLSRQFIQPRFPQAFFSFASSFTCCYSALFYPPFSSFIHHDHFLILSRLSNVTCLCFYFCYLFIFFLSSSFFLLLVFAFFNVAITFSFLFVNLPPFFFTG
jgi:hypothetical protein